MTEEKVHAWVALFNGIITPIIALSIVVGFLMASLGGMPIESAMAGALIGGLGFVLGFYFPRGAQALTESRQADSLNHAIDRLGDSAPAGAVAVQQAETVNVERGGGSHIQPVESRAVGPDMTRPGPAAGGAGPVNRDRRRQSPGLRPAL